MPNPYANNGRAAAFVDYYASDQMVQSSVDRLYHGGVARQQRARAAAEREAYPERFQPPVRRSQEEIDDYLQGHVGGELLRRQQRRVALQQAYSPTAVGGSDGPPPPRLLAAPALEQQVRRLYTDSLRRRQMREHETRKIFGADRTEAELVYGRRHCDPHALAERRERESGWRPVSPSVPYEDNRLSLSSQYDYYANPQKFSEVYIVSKQRRAMTEKEKSHQMTRLTALSRPLSVTPRRVDEERGRDDPPPFHVTGKVDYGDEF